MIHLDAPAESPAGIACSAAVPGESMLYSWESVADAEIIVAGSAVDELLASANKIRWVAFWNAGIDASLTPALLERIAQGLLVTNASGVHGPQMAEHAFALILAHTRGVADFVRSQAKTRGTAHPTRGAESWSSPVSRSGSSEWA